MDTCSSTPQAFFLCYLETKEGVKKNIQELWASEIPGFEQVISFQDRWECMINIHYLTPPLPFQVEQSMAS